MNMSKENHTRTKHYDDAHSRDRHVSGTGRGKEVQKDGSGKYSWGKIIDTGDTLLFGMGGRGNNEKEIVNEETITYDEYMAKKKDLQSSIHPLPEPRKANDGVDQSKWPQIPLKKSDN